MSSIVWRRRMTDQCAVLDQHFGRQRPAVVVRRHHRAVGAGVEDRHQVPDLGPRQAAVLAERVAALAERTDDVAGDLDRGGSNRPARSGGTRRTASAASTRSCRRRGSRTRSRPRRSLTSTTRDRSAPAGATMLRPGSRTMARPESLHDRQQRRSVVLALRHRRPVVRHAEAAAEIEVIDDDPVVAQFARQRHDRLRPRGGADRGR